MTMARHALAAVLALLASALSAPAAAETGTFLHVSDIHFDPFVPAASAPQLPATDIEDWAEHLAADPDQSFAKYGSDTNYALFASSLAAIAKAGADADFIIVTGDLLSHGFQASAAKTMGLAEGSAANDAFAVRTSLFVAESLKAALPDKPILLSLGNNDSSCGDYKLDPGGPYLAATREAVRSLAGADLGAADFDETYLAGGYYAARHPTLVDTTVVVLDDVLWSDEYENDCGTGGLEAATAMMTWLETQLADAKAAGGRIWLMHHIPVGLDAYATAHSKEATCAARIVPLLKEPFGSTYVRLLAEYGDVVVASFTGHLHFDDYRLLRDVSGTVTGVEKVAPAISPIFGQNPGFLTFTYDRTSGTLADFSPTYLANLEDATDPSAADWREEYAFAATYGQPDFSPAAAQAMWETLSEEGTADDTFRRLYNVSKGELAADNLDAWICAIGHADTAGFTECYCGG